MEHPPSIVVPILALYNNDFTLIIDIYVYETFSTQNLWKSAYASLLIKMLCLS